MRGDLLRWCGRCRSWRCPLCAVLSVTASDVVRVVYGDAWAPAAEALRWLALLAGVRILFEVAYDYLVVVGRSRALLAVQCAWTAVLVPAVWVGIERGGIGGAAAALAAVGVGVGLVLYGRELHRAGVEARALVGAVSPALLVAGGVAVAGAAVTGAGLGALLTLALCGAGTVVVLVVALWCCRADLDVVRGPRTTPVAPVAPVPTTATGRG